MRQYRSSSREKREMNLKSQWKKKKKKENIIIIKEDERK